MNIKAIKTWPGKIIVGIKLMHPANLREHNIQALLEKGELTEQEQNMLDDMQKGGRGAGRGAPAMTDQDYVDAWRR